MNKEKKALPVRENDILAVDFLKQNGNIVSDPFSKDVFLLHTIINEAMCVETNHEEAICLQKGDRVQLILDPQNKYNEKAILVKNETGHKLGYIPTVKNEAVYHLMNSGNFLFGFVCGGDIGEKIYPNNQRIEICIDVYMVD